MRNEDEEEDGVNRQVHEGDSEKEQEEGTTMTQVDVTTEKDEGEQREECNSQEEQEQQEDQVEMQTYMPEVCGISMDGSEQTKIVNDQKTAESDREEEKEDQKVKLMKRRRSIKVKPCLGVARKKTAKEDTLRNVNRYELLKDFGEME